MSARPVRPSSKASASSALNTSTGTTVPNSAIGSQATVTSTRAAPAPQQTRIFHAVEHQQATAPVSLQPVPDRLARVGCARLGTADGQPYGFGHCGQPHQQGLAVPGVDPAMSRQCSASLARAHAAASWVLPAPEVPVSTTNGLGLAGSVALAGRAGAGNRAAEPGYHLRRLGSSFRAGDSRAYGSLVPTVSSVTFGSTVRPLKALQALHGKPP